MTFSTEDRRYMSRALRLARQGLYTADPNPRVGAVLVRDGHVLGEGAHRRAGQGHAERLALEVAGDARGACCYVSLEPCAHTGRTGPCAEALIDAGVARVVAAMEDPNPRVAGVGLERLRAAGVRVQCGLLEDEARQLNPGFLRRMATGRPLVRVKLAMSLDGRTAMASGESRWITGDAAREDVQRLRARSSAIVTGVGTVLADEPALTVRPAQWRLAEYGAMPVRQPLRVVVDTGLRTPPQATVISSDGHCLVAATGEADDARAAALHAAGAETVRLAADERGGVALDALLDELGHRECNEVLVEAGPTLAGAVVRAGLADELVVYMAPVLLGSTARGLLELDLQRMVERRNLRLHETRRIGDDMRMTFEPRGS